MLFTATALTLVAVDALGAGSGDLQPSALRVLVMSVVGLLALLFWPGLAATTARSVMHVVAWSAAATLLAALALGMTPRALQPLAAVFSSCLMLLLMLLVAHTLAALLQALLRAPAGHPHGASETAGRTLACALALAGALPLWLGPLAELLSARHAWIIDAVIAASPLTHLAVASGNDLLRNQWLYQHANLAALPFSYPELRDVLMFYAAAVLGLALMVLAIARQRRAVADLEPNDPATELTP